MTNLALIALAALSAAGLVAGELDSCGTPAIHPVLNLTQINEISRIKGGEEAFPGSWPWQVRVGYNTGFSLHFGCGGSIIDERHILTAAHCHVGAPSTRKYIVRVGEHSNQITEASQKDYEVERVFNHPQYSSSQFTGIRNDITVLRLVKSIEYNEKVSPVCLAEQGSDAETGEVCVVTGWGSTVNQVTGKPRMSRRSSIDSILRNPILIASPVLKQALIPILSRSVCQTLWGPLVVDQHVCTATANLDREPCQGDSGGPLVCQVSGNSAQYVQRGVVSFGAGCGQGGPAVFTRVGHFRNWIKSVTDTV